MRNSTLQLAIVAENALIVHGLKHDLQKRFGETIEISCFSDFKTCLKKVRQGIDVVVVDSDLDGKKASEVFLSIKLVNSDTQGIVYTTADEVSQTIDHIFVGLSKASGHDTSFYGFQHPSKN